MAVCVSVLAQQYTGNLSEVAGLGSCNPERGINGNRKWMDGFQLKTVHRQNIFLLVLLYKFSFF